MSANWTDDKNHFPAASLAASSDRGRNHTLHEVPLCRWCFIQRVFKKKHTHAAEWGIFAPAQRQSLCEMGLFISEACVSLSEIQRLATHVRGAFSLIFYLFVFFPPHFSFPPVATTLCYLDFWSRNRAIWAAKAERRTTKIRHFADGGGSLGAARSSLLAETHVEK